MWKTVLINTAIWGSVAVSLGMIIFCKRYAEDIDEAKERIAKETIENIRRQKARIKVQEIVSA